jgi:SPP1 gp7 family putative phage head morphogenesis protein
MALCSCGHIHTNAKRKSATDKKRIDPTRTITLRRRYEAACVKRFKALRRDIIESILKQDALGLSRGVLLTNAPAGSRAFDFPTDARKIQAFRRWLDKLVDQGILEVVSRDGATITGRRRWQDVYVRSAYQKGLADSYPKLVQGGYVNPLEIGATAGKIGSATAFNVPIHANTLESLFTRNFEDLKGITDAMSAALSRTLTQGLAEGRGPRDIARKLAKQVDGIGIRRARVLARSEIIRAHAEATLNNFQTFGVDGVGVEAEWLTAGDAKVCGVCGSLSGRVYKIAEARGMLPAHPNCRCAWLPAGVGENSDSNKTSLNAPAVVASTMEAYLAEKMQEREMMEKSQPHHMEPLGGGVNETVILENDIKGVFKPVDGERSALRSHIEAGTYYKREVAASIIDEEIGLGLVPTTIVKEYGGQTGSFQRFVDGFTVAYKQPNFEFAMVPAEKREGMFLFDLLLWNTDRHGGNYMVKMLSRKKAEVRLIDHGLTLPSGAVSSRIPYPLWEEFLGTDLSAHWKKRIEGLKARQAEVTERLKALLNDSAMDLFWGRVDKMLLTGFDGWDDYY